MDKLLAVIRREYLVRVRSKWFILSTLFAPLLMIAVITLPALLFLREADRGMEIEVVDESGAVLPRLERATIVAEREIRLVPVGADDPTAARRRLLDRVRAEELDGFLFVPADVLETGRVEFWARDVSSPLVTENLDEAVADAVRRARARSLGLDDATVDRLSRGVELVSYRVTGAGVTREAGQTWITAQILGLAIYIVVLMYGAMMLRAAVSEKSSKMVEIILSSVRPWQLMLGKTLGVGGVGLTQLAIWMAFVVLLLAYAAASGLFAQLGLVGELPLGWDTMALFLGLFVTGYFLYAGLYSAIGAIATDEQEAAQIQLPVTIVAIVPAVVLAPVLGNPDGTLSVVLSWIPLFSPVIFMARYVIGATVIWEIPLVFVLLIVAIFVVGWLGGRIYRIGLLMTGKRPTLPEVVRWLRHG